MWRKGVSEFNHACSRGTRALGPEDFRLMELCLPCHDCHWRKLRKGRRLVRSLEFNGTLTDRLVHFFTLGQQVWACQVLIRNGDQWHAAEVPILDYEHAAAQFCRFLDSPSRKVEVRTGQINHDHIKLSPTSAN